MNMTDKEMILDIENFRPFSFSGVQCMYGTALMKSIVRMLKRLDVKPGETFVYDKRMARLRNLKYYNHACSQDFLYYGVSYEEDDDFSKEYECENFDVDGKCYRLWDYWEDPIPNIPDFINCGMLQNIHVDHLNNIYNYLRMEVKAPKEKRRFTIEKK